MTASWRVNSYGYPNPFTTERAKKAWQLFERFLQHTSYRELKESLAPRLDAHGVESWKANFEECGLLYVLAHDDLIQPTPAGEQLKAAVDSGDVEAFAWIGTNLLLRYRLAGTTGRRPRRPPHDTSDLLPYWFVLATALELDGIWQTEMYRVIAGVFTVTEAAAAVERIREARGGSFDILALPNLATRGAAYNSLNQVAVKAGLNHLTLTRDARPSPYLEGQDENYWSFSSSFRHIVELALGGSPTPTSACSVTRASWLERMPKAPTYSTEKLHFDAVGAEVPDLSDVRFAAEVSPGHAPTVDLGFDLIHLLTVGTHCVRVDTHVVRGPTSVLCVVGTGSRLVFNDDLDHTHIVVDKSLVSATDVEISLRQARRITDADYVRGLFEGATS